MTIPLETLGWTLLVLWLVPITGLTGLGPVIALAENFRHRWSKR